MTECKIGCMCLIADKIDAMATFYSNVFGANMSQVNEDGLMLYEGKFSGINFVLVPSSANKATATENKIHFDLYVQDIKQIIDLVEKHGGKTNNKLAEDDVVKCIGVFDPDGNFMAVKQKKWGAGV